MDSKILIVEDSPTVAYRLVQQLDATGYKTVTAETVEIAVNQIKKECFDAVLLDVVLPDGSGLDILPDLKVTEEAPAVIVMTGHGSESTAVKAMRDGADDYISKPVNEAELERVLSEALFQRDMDLKRRAEAEEVASDLAAASAVQIRLEQTDLPETPNWCMDARIVPARSIGGDTYGIVQNGDFLHVWVGDISGKGIKAALLSASVRSLIRHQAKVETDAEAIVNRIANFSFSDLVTSNAFLTLFFASIDTRTGRTKVIDAGHSHARIRRSDRSWEKIACPASPPIGFGEEYFFASSDLSIDPGDHLLIYTDGLVELGAEPDCEEGAKQLEACVDSAISNGVDRATEAVYKMLEEFEQTDDRTFVILGRSPSEAVDGLGPARPIAKAATLRN